MDNSTLPAAPHDALSAFVAELLGTTAPLMTCIDHMRKSAASGRSHPEAPPVMDVLAMLLRDVLAKVAERHPPSELAKATTILAEVGDAVCADLFLVPLDEPRAPRAGRGAARRSRRPR
jgi:hypothetical protein